MANIISLANLSWISGDAHSWLGANNIRRINPGGCNIRICYLGGIEPLVLVTLRGVIFEQMG